MKRSVKPVLAVLLSLLALSAIATKVLAREADKVAGSVGLSGVRKSDYPKHAKITMSEASKIALDKSNGHVASIALENEDGSLVYSVEVIDTEGLRNEILVDAGTGSVLKHERKIASAIGGIDAEDDEDDED
ncbi:MAG: PepSY domain-containing protein [Bdellovibrionaceae bacterium]|nr:PepSY domain-containing protein [Pseudobdellovibrionaceae bacterium]